MGGSSNLPSDKSFFLSNSRVAQWKRAGPITQRSVDRNYALLSKLFVSYDFPRPQLLLLSIPGTNMCPISAEDSALDF